MVFSVLEIMPPTVAIFSTLQDYYLFFGTLAGVIVVGYMVYAIIKNRARPGRPVPKFHEEGDWGHWKTVLLTICLTGSVLAVVEYESFAAVGLINMPNDPDVNVMVTAQQFSWTFTYPNGYHVNGNLTVPQGQIVILNLTSRDVTHSFYLPALDVAKDVQPGIYDQLWFNATNTGIYGIECRQLCGVGHAFMKANLTVVPDSAYNKWYSSLPTTTGAA